MTMQSSNLLSALRELPSGDESDQKRSFRENITNILNMDRAMYAAEFSAGVSFGLWYIFDDRTLMGMNIPFTGVDVHDGWREILTEAHQIQFPSESMSVWEHFLEADADSGTFDNVFMSPYKGKVAELLTKQDLEAQGWTQVTLAPELDTELIDIIGVNPEGYISAVQSKFGTSFTNSDVEKLISVESEEVRRIMMDVLNHDDVNIQGIIPDEPELYLSLASDTVIKASEAGTDLAGRLVADLGFNHEIVDGIEDGLETLSSNLGIDVPDGVGDIIPYAGAIIAGARLVHSVLKTEKEFKVADRTTRNKIQVVQSLTLMSRIGVTTTLATAGGMGGGALGSAFPGVGNLVGGIGGSLLGAGAGMYLNRHLQPHMLNLALNITGLTNDDLFYYKNKPRIDNVALNIKDQTRALAAPA